jgi:predicted ferric reductase
MQASNFKRYKPGQWVYLYIPQVALFQLHPFSAVSAEEDLTLLIAVVGDWTKKLRKTIRENPTRISRVWIDGGYGNITIAPPENYKFVVFVAGGAGISPVLSLLLALRNAPLQNCPEILFVWSSRHRELFYGFEQELTDLLRYFQHKLNIQLYCTDSFLLSATPTHASVNAGIFQEIQYNRPHFENIFSIVAYQARLLGVATVGVYGCGSSSIIKALHQTTNQTASVMFDLHTELF